MRFNFNIFLFLVTGIMLLLCLLPMPYAYYTVTRILVVILSISLAFSFKDLGGKWLFYYYIVITLLFQPIFKIPLGRTVWCILDVIVGLNFLKIAWNNMRIRDPLASSIKSSYGTMPGQDYENSSMGKSDAIASLLINKCGAGYTKLTGPCGSDYIWQEKQIVCHIFCGTIENAVWVKITQHRLLEWEKEFTMDTSTEEIAEEIAKEISYIQAKI